MDHERTNAFFFNLEKQNKTLFIITSYLFLKDTLRKANASQFVSPGSNLVSYYMFDYHINNDNKASINLRYVAF